VSWASSPEASSRPPGSHTPTLPDVVRAAGLRLWEDRQGVADLTAGVSLPAPVITWATRTPFRKWTSILGTPLLAARWRRAPVLRLAVHPFDFDHPETVASIRRVWRGALRQREAVGYDEALAEALEAAAP